MQLSLANVETVCSLADENQYIYFAFTQPIYSQRLTRALLDEMKTDFYRYNPDVENGQVTSKTVNAMFLTTLSDKYNDPGSFDKVSEAQYKIGELALTLQIELKKASTTNDQLNVKCCK